MIKLIFLAIVLLITEAKPLTKSKLGQSTKNPDRPKVSALLPFFKSEISLDTTLTMTYGKLQGLERIKRNLNSNRLCARIVLAESIRTNRRNPGDILESQHENLRTIYIPCSEDNHFFDGWGG
jgi:hypothetical protein